MRSNDGEDEDFTICMMNYENSAKMKVMGGRERERERERDTL